MWFGFTDPMKDLLCANINFIILLEPCTQMLVTPGNIKAPADDPRGGAAAQCNIPKDVCI
ncbi:hypothetical protein SESBI_19752 [Sesbania bispinosa]|nr:hypothetical protein SESBI_19752 [Sesbania bispinosa]